MTGNSFAELVTDAIAKFKPPNIPALALSPSQCLLQEGVGFGRRLFYEKPGGDDAHGPGFPFSFDR
jgi:hypothetical protein